MAEHGHFAWNELNTHDPDAGKRFCESVFDWTWEAMPTPVVSGTYWVARCSGKLVGGLFPLTAPAFAQVPDHWLSYLAVDDVDARAVSATANGAMLIRSPWTVPGVGRLAFCACRAGPSWG